MVLLRVSRVYHINKYQGETKLAQVIGLSKFPSGSTIYRFLEKFSTLTFCRRIQRVNRDLIKDQLEMQKQVVIDGDTSTVESYENKKQGAEKGFNKKNPGGNCFQALTFFGAGFALKSDLLGGKAAPLRSYRTIAHLKEVRKICGRIDWVRLDAGFISGKTLSLLDKFSVCHNLQEKINYVVNAGMKCWGGKEALRKSKFQEWHKVEKGVYLQDQGWSKVYYKDGNLHRLILVKQFFDGGKDSKGKESWKYYLLCTNSEMPAVSLYYFYHQRQTIENFFDEAKNDYFINNLPCRKLLGNSLLFNIKALAFNLMCLFRHEVLREEDASIRLSTFQRNYMERDISFDGCTLFIYRYDNVHYRRVLVILQRLKKLGVALKYRIC